MRSEYEGLRCVGLVRTSTLGQTENGIQQQLESCRRFAEEKGMIWLDAERAPGVSAYQTKERDDIDRIIARKQAGEDFQIVIVFDYSRLTRGGADHGSHLLYRFREVGLRVVSVTNDIPDNVYAPVIRALEFMKDQGYSEKTALNTARGRMAAIISGRSTHCGQPPFAVDRLYFSDKGEKLFRIRNLPDGRQVKLVPDLDSEDVLGYFEPNLKLEDGSVLMRHFKKQPHERVTLVPGDPEDVETVRHILQQFYVEGIGTPTITYELNLTGRRAHDGGLWNISSVFDVVYQPVYVGKGICNFFNEASIYNRSKGQPRRVERPADEKRKLTYRPEADWEIVEYSELQGKRGFVPPELQPIVWERQLRRYRDKAAGVNRRKENDSHIQSSFFLKGAVYTTDGYRMRGHSSNRTPNARYYVMTRNVETPTHGKRECKHLFPAKPLENAVKEAISEVFQNLDPHLLTIRSFVDRRLKEMLREDVDVQKLQTERQAVAAELAFCTTELAVLGPEMLKKKIDPLKIKLTGLDTRIEVAKRARTGLTGDTDEIMNAVSDALRNAAEHLDKESSPAFRNVVSTLTRSVVDLDGRTAEIEVRVPISFLADPKGANLEVCLGSSPLPNRRNQTHNEEAVVLVKFRCVQQRENQKPCLSCLRQAA